MRWGKIAPSYSMAALADPPCGRCCGTTSKSGKGTGGLQARRPAPSKSPKLPVSSDQRKAARATDLEAEIVRSKRAAWLELACGRDYVLVDERSVRSGAGDRRHIYYSGRTTVPSAAKEISEQKVERP